MTTASTVTPSATASASTTKRRQALGAIAAVTVLGGVLWGGYHLALGRHIESTDNAYVAASLAQITPQLSGTVQAILADDTDFVKAGQVLVRLDPADAQLALDQAEAALAQTVREVRTLYANNSALKSQVQLRAAELGRVRSDLARAEDAVRRRTPLVDSGAVGREEFTLVNSQLTAARNAAAAAEAGWRAAQEQLVSNQALTEGIAPEHHPNVQKAAAKVREAFLSRQRVELVAPMDGYVARRNVQLGQRVQAGAPLMAVIPLQAVWVDANFKESQLQSLRIDQPVELRADVYGSDVIYHGKVVGLGAGTGSAFALLPAQNATGNWIKVVQRVPVRVSVDAAEIQAHPLRVGLSMVARVDVSDTSGRVLALSPKDAAPTATPAEPAAADAQAQSRVDAIIGANLGTAVPPASSLHGGAPTRPAASSADNAHAGSTPAV